MLLQTIKRLLKILRIRKFGKAISGLRASDLFDSDYYLEKYVDVAEAGVDPLLHYLKFGVKENRDPSPSFNTKYYLDSNPDVRASGINPLVHYFLYGRNEGRSTLPPKAFHLSKNAKELLKKTSIVDEAKREAKSISFQTFDCPDATIIVPVFNKVRYTLRCLKALSFQETNYTFEVILADDHSTDATQNLTSLIDGLTYVRNAKNLGFLLNCNNAARLAQGKHIIFLNNDTAPFSDWLSELLDPLINDKQVGLVGSMLLYADGKLQEAGGFVFEDASGWNYGRQDNPKDCKYNFIREVDYCSGASLAISKDLWNRLGGFDELYKPAYYEDTDLAFRVRENGYKVVYTPFSKAIHFEGVSSGTDLTSGVKKYQRINQPKFQDRWKHELVRRPKPKSSMFSVWGPYKKHTLLWIDALTLTPDQDAGSVYAFNFLKSAHDQGWGITFIPFFNQRHMGEYTESLQRLGIQCWYQPYLKSLTDYLQVYGEYLDVVVLSRVTVASKTIEDIKTYAPQAKVIFNTVDLHFLRQAREYTLNNKTSEENKRYLEALKKEELGIIEEADLTLLVTGEEEKVVKQYLPFAKTDVVPIMHHVPGPKNNFHARKDICFLGGFAHTPNIDAVEHFIADIWGLVKKGLPDCRFIIAGSNIPEQIQSLASDDILVEGFIPELHTLFERVKLSVVPLRYGAGMKGKIVSSLSFGVPVVATSIAVEGMDLVDGLNVSIADDVHDFSNRIIKLYYSEEDWQVLSRNSVDTAKEKFSPDKLSPKISNILARLID